MKRGAERDLNKDNADDDDEIEEVPGEGFRKASENVLASRPMRGLPKRSFVTDPGAAPQDPAPAPEATSTSAPKFGGFSGFGPPSNNAFPFTTPVGPSPFNTTPSQPSLFKPPPSTQTVASTASNTAKTFASFLDQPSPKPGPMPSVSTAPTPSGEAPSGEDPALLKYYTSLRGLNISFLDALSKATEEDPFADISDLLDRYKSLRLNVQNEFDEKSKTSTEPPPAPKPAFMPTPPANFANFGQPKTSTSSSFGSNGGGFESKSTTTSSASQSALFSFTSPPKPAPASGFAFPTSSATPSTTTANPFVVAPSSESSSPFGGSTSSSSTLFGTKEKGVPSSSSFAFGSPSAPSTGTDKGVSSTSSFTFGTSSAPSTTTSPFGATGKSTSAPVPFAFSTPPPSGTGTSAFGSVTSSSTTNVFGSDKPSFSTTSPAKAGAFGNFGNFGKSAGGSIGNPVGFGFGSPPKTPDAEAITSGATSSSDDVEKKGDAETTGSQGQAKDDGESTSGLLAKNPHDEEGEGEEQEDTIHAIKLKAFRLRKADEKEGSPWLELGFGVMRLKKHKETEARRVLLRNSSTGKINIVRIMSFPIRCLHTKLMDYSPQNFNIYSGLKPTQTKKTLAFIGHDEAGASQTYSVRLQSEEQAILLKEVFDREIAFVKAKSDD
ncbi:hypothetical protein FPV67DRAFT_1448373 [Lyophyllum atratum]|nr:hypothetical protein FPV67DRAFT_1448373 [Lyophyllum atratum]